ncbi:MAG: SEL1-like repeat protein [Holophagaceae bacterium]|nr:SEL1-like repeat protein [Holophagaceae bacterium]
MNDSPSRPKDKSSGKRNAGDTVPALDARAAAEEALRHAEAKLGLGETLIVPPPGAPPPGAGDRLVAPLDSLVSPSEGTVRLGRNMAMESSDREPGGLDPNATARLPRRQLVSPSEGTVMMSTVPPLPPPAEPGTGPVQRKPGEPDTVPGLMPGPSPHEGTVLMPVADLQPMARPSAADATLILHAGAPAAPSEGTMMLPAVSKDPAASEGTMVMPVMAKDPAASEGTMVMPVMAKDPAASEGTMVMPVMAKDPAASEGTMVMPVMAKEPAASEGTMVMPVVAKEPAASEGTMVMPVVAKEPAASEGTLVMPAMTNDPAASEGTMVMPVMTKDPAAGEGTQLMAATLDSRHLESVEPEAPARAEASVPTAAEVIRETLLDEPDSEARTIRVTQANLPELRLPDLPDMPELAPPALPPMPSAEAADPVLDPLAEEPQATLHLKLKDMPETRYREEAPAPMPEPAAPDPVAVAPTVALTAHEPVRSQPVPQPMPVPVQPTAPAVRPAAKAPAPDPEAAPGRSFAALWLGVSGVILLGFAALLLYMWKPGLFGGKGSSPGPDAGDAARPAVKAPPPSGDEGANIPEAMRPAYEKALAGDPNAMRYLGVCFVNGLGVPADRTEGLKWYRRAAAAGSAAAQRDLQALEAQGIR